MVTRSEGFWFLNKTKKGEKKVQKSAVSISSSKYDAKQQPSNFQMSPDQSRPMQKKYLSDPEDYFWFDHVGIGGDLL